MNQFSATEIFGQWDDINKTARLYMFAAGQPNGHERLQPKEYIDLQAFIGFLRMFCFRLELIDCLVLIGNLEEMAHHSPCSYHTVNGLIKNIIKEVPYEASKKRLAFIPTRKLDFFEEDELFGKQVNEVFPKAKSEIKDAGNCIATDLNTAAVFHLMRVVEFGLRELAVQLKAKALIKKLKQTKIPIELGTWEEIISTLEAKLAELQKTIARSHRRDQKIETFVELLKDFRAIKDLWRNKVMHTRATYDEKQASAAFNHVRGFMQKLAENSLNRVRF